MRTWSVCRFVLLSCLMISVSGPLGRAQERLPDDVAASVALQLNQTLGQPADAQVAVDANPDRGEAYHHGDMGFLVMPDRKLTADVLNAAGADVVPVGHLWLKGISPIAEGSTIAVGKHRSFTVTVNNETFDVRACLLGARRRDEKLELVVFGSGKTPVLTVPLEPDTSGSTASLAASPHKVDDETGRIELILAGKYKAKILVKRAD